ERAARIAAETFERIETHPLLAHRRRLLVHVLGGLRTLRARDLVTDRVSRWVVAVKGWRAGVYSAMSKWPRTAQTIAILWSAMHDEEGAVQIEASQALAACAGGDREVGAR